MGAKKHISVTPKPGESISFKVPSINDTYGILDANVEEAHDLFVKNQSEDALALLDKVIAQADDKYPNLYKAYFNKARIFQKWEDFEASEKFYRKCIELSPNHALAHNNLAVILKNKNDFEAAEKHYMRAIRSDPSYYISYYNLAVLYSVTKKMGKAQVLIRDAIRVEPDYIPARSLYNYIINKEALIKALKEALEKQPEEGRLVCDLALAYEFLKDYDSAVAYFKEALASSYKISAPLYNHFGKLVRDLKKYGNDDIEILQRGIKEYPDDYYLYNNLAISLQQRNKRLEAKVLYDKSLKINPKQFGVYHNQANIFYILKNYHRCIEAEKHCLELKPDYVPAYVNIISSAQRMADWNGVNQYYPMFMELARAALKNPENVPQNAFLVVFNLLGLPLSNSDYTSIASLINVSEATKRVYTSYNTEKSKKDKIRIGYISPDFSTAHPVGLLLNQIFSLHDSSKFETFAYGLTDFGGGSGTKKIEKSFDHFESFAYVNDNDAAKKIYDDGIDILVDLAGYTRGARLPILAAHPAPLQIHYMGYTASMQADYIDYLITSKEVVPNKLSKFFTEKFIYMPEGTYSTYPREIVNKDLKRENYGLPENAIVYCCFNSVTRIDREVFTSWMHILENVPDSVLWLYEENEDMRKNLCQFAESLNVDSKRLIFLDQGLLTDRWHHQLADLWLDTFTLSSGTGAILCANAGLPVLTLAGETPQSRVGAGVAIAANSKDMICSSVKEYEKKAIDLGKHPRKLKSLKKNLIKDRDKMPLFNPERFVRHLEDAYETIWERYLDDKKPETIVVKKK